MRQAGDVGYSEVFRDRGEVSSACGELRVDKVHSIARC